MSKIIFICEDDDCKKTFEKDNVDYIKDCINLFYEFLRGIGYTEKACNEHEIDYWD